MSTRNEETLPATRPRSRKSLSAVSSAMYDKENVTADLGALTGHKRMAPGGSGRPVKKSRSKSIGPGGLDNNIAGRQELIALPVPRSILKPTIPPLSEIPLLSSLRRTSPRKSKSPRSPLRSIVNPTSTTTSTSAACSATPGVSPNDPFSTEAVSIGQESRVSLRTEEEQQQAVRDRQEQERGAMENDVKARRDARRKSLANRRVSFAPEATLHTWDVVEYMQDSTASSSATHSTRRDSATTGEVTSSTNSHSSSHVDREDSEPPSTPSDQVEDDTIESPAHQRDLHQKKHRRSSGIPPLNFNNPDDEFMSSSPFSGSSGVDADEPLGDFGDDDNSASDSDLDDEDTAMSLVDGDTTSMSLASPRSVSSNSSSVRLEDALRLAARQAGTQGIDFDENSNLDHADDQDEDEELISFTPWTKSVDVLHDKENLNPFSPAFKASTRKVADVDGEDSDAGMDMDMDMTKAVGRILPGQEIAEDEEMTMDMTTAVGGIMSSSGAPGKRRKSTVDRRRSTRRQSSAIGSENGDETMDLTRAMGAIQHTHHVDEEHDISATEDMTMEFTSVVSGILAQNPKMSGTLEDVVSYPRLDVPQAEQESVSCSSPMDMTVSHGIVLPSDDAIEGDQEENTVGMDMTQAVGRILPGMHSRQRSQAKRLMEEEVDSAEPISSPFQAAHSPEMQLLHETMAAATEAGSPSVAVFQGKGLRRSAVADVLVPSQSEAAARHKHGSTKSSPARQEQSTPQSTRLSMSKQNSPARFLRHAGKSEDKTTTPGLPQQDESAATTPKASVSESSNPAMSLTSRLFRNDSKTGLSTPKVLLTPSKRLSSGLGIDKQGLGSPKLAAILDRRCSIGDASKPFSPGQFEVSAPGVRFDNLANMEHEIDSYREEEKSRENGRAIMEREVDVGDTEKDATLNLKEMIESLSPKKRALRGRKSLHVGAAKGILGKRPAELDSDDDDNDTAGVKRLKNHQGSPVKNVKLQAPPTKEETTGRLNRSLRFSPGKSGSVPSTSTPLASPTRPGTAEPPRRQDRFRNTKAHSSPRKSLDFQNVATFDNPETVLDEAPEEEDPIQLQDFLNMTSIRFMELNTTKRRHTVAPNDFANGQDVRPISLEDCVVAGACTVPMLELFQHSCRELKKYISEGRSVVREIETETFEENPPLFKEYLSATPDVRTMMDNQFKNVKTHARLTSKGQWYDWRMQLLGGLKAGLSKMMTDMRGDETLLDFQLQGLAAVVPSLVQQYQIVSKAEADLQAAAAAMADCDQDELQDSRDKIVDLTDEVQDKKQKVAELQAQIDEKEMLLQKSVIRKQVVLDDIREAEKTREECRGWTAKEVTALKDKVDELERRYGWTITGISGTTVSMSYITDLELVFDISAFKTNQNPTGPQADAKNSRIDLWYIGSSRRSSPSPLTLEKEFFLENIRDHIRGFDQSQTRAKSLLDAVSVSWKRALYLDDQIHALRVDMPTTAFKTSDNSMNVEAAMLMVAIQTKIKFSFQLSAVGSEEGLAFQVVPSAKVAYGNGFNEEKLSDFVGKRCGGSTVMEGAGAHWYKAIGELEEKLLSKGAGRK